MRIMLFDSQRGFKTRWIGRARGCWGRPSCSDCCLWPSAQLCDAVLFITTGTFEKRDKQWRDAVTPMSFRHCASSVRRIELSRFKYSLNKVVFNCIKCPPSRVFLHRGARTSRHAAAATAGESLTRLTHRIILTRLSKWETRRKFHADPWLIFLCVHWFLFCLLVVFRTYT